MGWASGSSLLDDIAKLVMPLVPEEKRRKLSHELIKRFLQEDCDTFNEVEQSDIRKAYDELYPPEDDL